LSVSSFYIHLSAGGQELHPSEVKSSMVFVAVTLLLYSFASVLEGSNKRKRVSVIDKILSIIILLIYAIIQSVYVVCVELFNQVIVQTNIAIITL